MNSDYVIHIATKTGRRSSYRKDGDAWTQIATTGIVRRMTAEQLLSHLLPPLAGEQRHLTVTVERRTGRSAAKRPRQRRASRSAPRS